MSVNIGAPRGNKIGLPENKIKWYILSKHNNSIQSSAT
jgi:hypothetical protein